MTINKKQENDKLTLQIEGRLDTLTAPELEEVIKNVIDGQNELEFDFKNLEYISSAGLRVLLRAQKIMNEQGKMYITGASEDILDIFEITGFSEILEVR